MTSEPIVQLEDLRRSFTVRQKVGGCAGRRGLCTPSTGSAHRSSRARRLATSERMVPGSPPRSRC